MFDSSKTITRIAGGLDLLIDVATLGEYGLEEVVDAPVVKTSCSHAARSRTSFNPQPRSRRERCAANDRKVVELGRFLRPETPSAGDIAPSNGPEVAGHGTTLAPVISINSRVAARQACPENPDPDYTPCTPAARRLAFAA